MPNTILCGPILRNKPRDSQSDALAELERIAEGKTLWQRIKRQVRRLQTVRGWRVDHEPLEYSPAPTDGAKNKRIVTACNLGQVAFDAQGLPAKHTLCVWSRTIH